MDWNDQHGYVDISISKYLPSFFKKTVHEPLSRSKRAPHKWTALAYRQTHSLTEYIQDEMIKLMDYCATYPSSVIHFHTSGMILHVETDAAYLVAFGANRRIVGYY